MKDDLSHMWCFGMARLTGEAQVVTYTGGSWGRRTNVLSTICYSREAKFLAETLRVTRDGILKHRKTDALRNPLAALQLLSRNHHTEEIQPGNMRYSRDYLHWQPTRESLVISLSTVRRRIRFPCQKRHQGDIQWTPLVEMWIAFANQQVAQCRSKEPMVLRAFLQPLCWGITSRDQRFGKASRSKKRIVVVSEKGNAQCLSNVNRTRLKNDLTQKMTILVAGKAQFINGNLSSHEKENYNPADGSYCKKI